MTKVAAIVGPTASGKTDLALAVASALGAEIVSLDSMQVYRRMDVGTDKLAPEQRRGIPHHMIDVVEPSHDVTVAEFQGTARAAIADITGRGVLPLLVGGSGLYFRAVVDDLQFPPTAPDVRAELEEEAAARGAPELHRRLTELDAPAAARIEPTNARRVVRALEVIEITGRPFSENRAWDEWRSIYRLAVAGLERDRADLHRRIEDRVDAMLERGIVAEARALEPILSRQARQALGYRQILEAPSTAATRDVRDAIVRATKRFARRQESWFRADPRIHWFDATADGLAETVIAFFTTSLGLALGR